MEQYKASIDSVDTALSRLNQTLAAYRMSQNRPGKSQPFENGVHSAVEPATVPSSLSPGTAHTAATNGEERPSPAPDGVRCEILSLRASKCYPESLSPSLRLERLSDACAEMADDPYCMPVHIFIAIEYLGLGYPDLAVGAAYKAMQLYDAMENESDEYHRAARDSIEAFIQQIPIPDRVSLLQHSAGQVDDPRTFPIDSASDLETYIWTRHHFNVVMYRIFVRGLLLCNCLRTAHIYLSRALQHYPHDAELLTLDRCKSRAVSKQNLSADVEQWPDGGYVRREIYPWNDHEPDRLKELDTLNAMMSEVSEKLEVLAVDLPDLCGKPGDMVTQLGVFAKEDIAPGEVLLDEVSMLTANNKLQDALCDACSAELPALDSEDAQNVVACPECEVVFCSAECLDRANDSYHPALCDKDVEAIAKDVPPQFAAHSLYALLLLRALAMAETQEVHPLDLREVKYIWGDFVASPPPRTDNDLNGDRDSKDNTDHNADRFPHSPQPTGTLPFSFTYNVTLPFHMLEKMDIDIFARAAHYDVWIFNTLYAKFRGTASARLSGLGGRAVRGPEVSAVHPMWCLANHCCDPNATWRWGGSIRLWAREQRVRWSTTTASGLGDAAAAAATAAIPPPPKPPGLRKGDEVLNHYCDVDLPVDERRQWASGALGGECLCERCVFEAAQPQDDEKP